MRKTKAAIAAGIAGAAAAVVGVAPPAEAAPAAGFTPGYLNLYSEYNQTGNSQYFYVGFEDLQYLSYHGAAMSMNDTITSYDNDTDSVWCFYSDAHYGGHYWDILPHTRGNFDYLNEQISSFYREAPNGYCGRATG